MAGKKWARESKLKPDKKVRISVKGKGSNWTEVPGCLDSGCLYNVGPLSLEKFAYRTMNMKHEKTFITPGETTIKAVKLISMDVRLQLKSGKLDLQRVLVYLIPSQAWNELLIGNLLMENEGFSPADALAVRIEEGKVRSDN